MAKPLFMAPVRPITTGKKTWGVHINNWNIYKKYKCSYEYKQKCE